MSTAPPRPARIGIVTGAHLCRNPRVVKEASALAAAGHDVVVIGPALDDALAAEDREIAAGAGWRHRYAVDVRADAGWRGQRARLVRRAGVEATRRLGIERPEALGYGVRSLLDAARDLGADLTIGHQEVGTWVCARLARAGRRVGVDVEDWYSRHPTPDQRAAVPLGLLRDAERTALGGAAYATTTSRALADALAESYGVAAPRVVYNAFPWADREALDGRALDRPAPDGAARLSLHWVSQTIGPDRGLDLLFDGLRHVPTPVDVHLRGGLPDAHAAWLHAAFPSDVHGLHVHPLVPPGELLSRIAEHDVGLALETSGTVNHDLTVSNKILHYLLGGLAVVATRTTGQEEVADQAPEAVTLVGQGDARAMGAAIAALAADPDRLRRSKAAALDAARRRFCWERQAPAVVEAAAVALAHPAPLNPPL
ncbi:glycosyltransferase [Rubrivirga litoralis]|uniref:Glycosyltransferase n=1 Tax=Rubrivirga litoralis TaxID=3075598 RepID=A0ABU3BSF1_9BACT|nr:glycosyltransferase [Rubrivirga sp. F394]MDT0632214.1 glycosyltransferase [Rubrivirga sp. F394]